MPIKAVIFDYGGVLMTYQGATRCFKDLAQRHGVDWAFVQECLLKQAVLQHVSDETGLDLFRGEYTCDELENIYIPRLSVQKGCPMQCPVPFVSTWMGDEKHQQYAEGMISALRQLPALGFLTGLLTNNCYLDKERKLRRTPIDESLFDVVVESAVEGTRKPEERIFEICLQRFEALGVLPSDCLFLDDQPENLEAAKKIGWQTMLVNPVDPNSCVVELEMLLGVRFDDSSSSRSSCSQESDESTLLT
ncbi:unnamed protein product, partial [Mesorhabditis belari]|uniref:Uncharacterized protein n=1 Tax=Mesorhabditis belari TaxID=2138241 RepID=A0AAF3ELX5_9BILA